MAQQLSFAYGQLSHDSLTTKADVKARMEKEYGALFDMFEDVQDFHRKFGLEYEGRPRMLPPDLEKFRCKFMLEELEEYVLAVIAYHDAETAQCRFEAMAKAFDALIDLVYVALGTADLHGFPFHKGWDRVHKANMSKVRAERASDSKRGSTYDVVKPPGWKAPDLLDLVKGEYREI
jgi:predicted HAD superfamily Cof-like phosphohydrolase